MAVCMKFETSRPIIYPQDGPAVTGPGSVFLMRNRDSGLYVVRLYAKNDKSRKNKTGSHVLGLYKSELNAKQVIDVLQEAEDNSTSVVYIPAENEAGELTSGTTAGRDGKIYPKSHKVIRQRIIDAIKDNPAVGDNAIARLTGSSPHTVKKYREKLKRSKDNDRSGN